MQTSFFSYLQVPLQGSTDEQVAERLFGFNCEIIVTQFVLTKTNYVRFITKTLLYILHLYSQRF